MSFDTALEEPAAVLEADGYICGEIYEADESCIHKLDLFIKAITRNLYM